ncbi:7499_t:CDS:2, partial [Dentiscutata erythropus]
MDVRCIRSESIENNSINKKKERRSDDVVNVRCVVNTLEDNAKFNDSGGEAADSRANEHGIISEKDEQKANIDCQSLEASVSHLCTIRTLNGMLKAWNYINEPLKLYNLSYQRTNNAHLKFGSSILQSVCIQKQYKSIKARELSIPNFYGDRDYKKST